MNQKYLFIFDDNAMQQRTEFTSDDQQSCEDGVLDVIRIHSATGNFQYYYNGDFNDIEKE